MYAHHRAAAVACMCWLCRRRRGRPHRACMRRRRCAMSGCCHVPLAPLLARRHVATPSPRRRVAACTRRLGLASPSCCAECRCILHACCRMHAWLGRADATPRPRAVLDRGCASSCSAGRAALQAAVLPVPQRAPQLTPLLLPGAGPPPSLPRRPGHLPAPPRLGLGHLAAAAALLHVGTLRTRRFPCCRARPSPVPTPLPFGRMQAAHRLLHTELLLGAVLPSRWAAGSWLPHRAAHAPQAAPSFRCSWPRPNSAVPLLLLPLPLKLSQKSLHAKINWMDEKLSR